MLANCMYCKKQECDCDAARIRYEDATVLQALGILERRMKWAKKLHMTGVANYVRLKMALLEHEEFACLFFNTHQFLIEYKVMSIGTLDQCAIYPREFVKAALLANAVFVVFAHNHPGGQLTPSLEDIRLTQALQRTLDLVDVQVVDHLIVAGNEVYSMLDNGHMPKHFT